MDTKLKSKTHLQNTYWVFEPFFKSKKIFKNTEFHADFELMNISNSEKSAYFRKVFANNFFGAFFQNFFNGFEINKKFCVF